MGKKDVLVFCAHSDDHILGPGGTLAKYAEEGMHIRTLMFSYGEMSHPHFKKKIIVKERIKEAEAADKEIGGKKIEFMKFRDGKLQEDLQNPKAKKKVKSLLKKYKPAKVFTHSDQDPLPDHKAVNKLVLDIIDELNLKCEVYTFEVWTPFRLRTREHGRLVVDISDTFTKKLAALKHFKSQTRAMLMLKWSVYVKAFFSGIRNDFKFAEVFDRVR